MNGLRIGVDGAVDVLDLPPGDLQLLDALRGAVGGGYVERVKCGDIGRITTKAEHADRTLAMWVDDEGALGATGQRPNLLANGLMSVLGLTLKQSLYGPVVFTETDEERGLTLGLQPVTLKLLQGILHRLTVENLDILAEVNREHRYTAVAHFDGKRQGVEIVDTTDLADVRQLWFYDAATDRLTQAMADQLLTEAGWVRVSEWGDSDWLYEGEAPVGQELSATIRKV